MATNTIYGIGRINPGQTTKSTPSWGHGFLKAIRLTNWKRNVVTLSIKGKEFESIRMTSPEFSLEAVNLRPEVRFTGYPLVLSEYSPLEIAVKLPTDVMCTNFSTPYLVSTPFKFQIRGTAFEATGAGINTKALALP